MTTVDNRTLLIVEVFPSNSRPHFLRAEGPENGVYVRLGSTNRQADRELIGELRLSAEGVSFDEMPLPELSADDLDLKVARRAFAGKRELDEQELITLKLLRSEQGRLVPTKEPRKNNCRILKPIKEVNMRVVTINSSMLT